MSKYHDGWDSNGSRFLRHVTRTCVQNVAAQNMKNKAMMPASQNDKTNAEGPRDLFVRMIVVIAETTAFDFRNVLSCPIIMYPLSLAHGDGAHVKTEKSELLKKLESIQTKE